MEIAPISCDTDGLAIIAVRTNAVQLPWGLGPAGHVGVGFQNEDGTWTIGAVENPGGSPVVLPGADNRVGIVPVVGAVYDNGGWVESYKTLLEVAAKFHSLGYDGIKVIQVRDTQSKQASAVINNFPTRGYDVVTNNCLKATIDVLNAYGIGDLPNQLIHQAPTDYYANVKGEEYLWDASKKKYTDLATGMPLGENPSTIQEKLTSEPATTAIQQPIDLEKATLTLYVQDGNKNGPVIPGAKVACQDGSGNSFQQTTDSSGYVTIIGDQGTWSFTVSAEGYETKTWDQEIAEKSTKRAILTKSATPSQEQLIAVTLHVFEGNEDGAIISGANVAGQDGSAQSFQDTTNNNGFVTFKGYPGTWSFTVSANGYETNSWIEPITDYCTRNAFLQKIESQEHVQPNSESVNQPSSQVTLTLYVHDGSASGPKISGAKVTGKDGAGNSFKKTTRSSGYVTIEGDPGTWSFKASADGYETNSWDQEISKTSTKHAFLEESATSTTQGSESSVVGKWSFHFKRESWESSSDKVTRDPDSEEWDSMIQFHSDGTYTESTSDSPLTGEWIQSEDTIRLQGNGEFHFEPDHYVTTTEVSESLDGRIEGSIMSGKGSRLCHLTTIGDEATDYNSYSADISQTYSWSANRDD